MVNMSGKEWWINCIIDPQISMHISERCSNSERNSNSDFSSVFPNIDNQFNSILSLNN